MREGKLYAFRICAVTPFVSYLEYSSDTYTALDQDHLNYNPHVSITKNKIDISLKPSAFQVLFFCHILYREGYGVILFQF